MLRCRVDRRGEVYEVVCMLDMWEMRYEWRVCCMYVLIVLDVLEEILALAGPVWNESIMNVSRRVLDVTCVYCRY